MDLEETLKAEIMALRACTHALLISVGRGERESISRIRLRAEDTLRKAFPEGSEQAEHAATALDEIFEGFGPHL